MKPQKGSALTGSLKDRRPSLAQPRVVPGRQKSSSTDGPAPGGTREQASAWVTTAAPDGASKDGNVTRSATKCAASHPTRSSQRARPPSKGEVPQAKVPSAGPGRRGDVDEGAEERWTTASSASAEMTLTTSDTIPLGDSDVRGLRVVVSPSGVLLDTSDVSSPEEGQHSPRTVRFQAGGRKSRDEESPSGRSRRKRSRFCCGHGLCVLCALLAMLPATLTAAYLLRIWSSTDARWHSFCLEYDMEACVDAMDELHALLTTWVDPCDNMYAYTCEQWDRGPESLAYNRTFVSSTVFKLYNTVNRRVNGTLLTGPTLKPNVFGRHVLQSLYASCYASLSAAKDTPLDVPSELSVLLVEHDMRAGMEVALNTSLQWGLEMIWAAHLERNGSASSYVHLYAGSSIADKFEGKGRSMSAAAVLYLKHVVHGLTTKHSTTIVDRAMLIDEALQRELCCTEDLDSGWLPLDDLDVFSWYLNEKQWWNAFARHLWKKEPEAPGLQKQIMVTGYKQMKNAFATLEQQTDDVALLYLYLLASAEVLQYDYRKSTFTKGAEDSGVVFSCLEATRRVLSPSWAYVVADVSGYAHDTVAVGDMYEMFLSLSNESPYSTSMDNVTRFRASSQISALAIDAFPAFLPIKGVDIITFASDFRLQGIFGSDYLWLLSMSRLVVRDSEQRAGLDHLNRDQANGILEFSLLTQSLVVPTAHTISPVFYEEDVPESFNYGTLGSLIAKELSEVLAPGSPSITEETTMEASGEWWTEVSRRSFNKTMQCWQRLANKTDVNGTSGWGNSSSAAASGAGLFERSLFVWSRGARLAFDAMRRVVQRRALRWPWDARALEKHWQMQQRIFFARFCLVACSTALDENGPRGDVLSSAASLHESQAASLLEL
ncbi:hypothetical protein HPB50_021897 [Hyalomma asiaticum]|uniref:Uncharacterized protein n=1 Tax=Hyalomma asiaticum TaxID=266040 RepID=A0ACB7T0T8_HYAAI|nr:hypothetical protein HPB50_021897 [Hyalomma asiaticum]